MKNKNPIEALEIIYKVTRVVNLNAEQHDEIKFNYEIIKEALLKEETKKEEV